VSNKIIQNIEAAIEIAKQKRREERSNAYQYGKVLVADTKDALESLQSKLENEDKKYVAIADQLSTEILQCGIDSFKSKMGNVNDPSAGPVELMHEAKTIATDAQVVKRIEENIEGIEDWVTKQSFMDDQYHLYDFDKILLQTAFSFMTCDGDIDKNEVALIREMAVEKSLFGDIDIDIELEFLIEVINAKGMGFLKDYFKVLKNAELSTDQELQLVEIALKTLEADAVIDYNEVKFFRIFRTLLAVSDSGIKNKFPDFPDEFLETDIFSSTYLDQLFDDYFDQVEIPEFDKSEVSDQSKFIDPEAYNPKD